MEHEEPEQAKGQSPTGNKTDPPKRLGRTWSERLNQPVKFRQYSGIDGGGRHRIFFKFELAPGQTKLDPEVAKLLADMKIIGGRPTQLKFERDNVHGKVYRLPNTERGRVTAEQLASKLLALGARLEREQGQSR